MNFLDAAFEILQKNKSPLHFSEIAQRALGAGLLVTSGQTPDATMGSRLYVDTNRPESRFRRVGRGFFELRLPADSDEIGQRVEDINKQTRERLRQALTAFGWASRQWMEKLQWVDLLAIFRSSEWSMAANRALASRCKAGSQPR